jgi:redox-sensitive bicupin YhaK (pirin superfamily)
VTIHADASIRSACSTATSASNCRLRPDRLTYVHLARGALQANGQALAAGDALTLSGEALLSLDSGRDAEVLVFDLAP